MVFRRFKTWNLLGSNMAKSLGQIHTVNFDLPVGADQEKFFLDVSGELTNQLQRQVRQNNVFKIVGIDMQVSELGGTGGGGQISGKLRYYSPTKGRCNAYRNAYKAVRTAMSLQGVKPSKNRQYDFRVPLSPLSEYSNTNNYVNAATLDGTHELVFQGSADTNTNILDVYNDSVEPINEIAPNYSAGFNTFGNQNTPTDFVLNDGLLFSGNPNAAEVGFENIPFQLSYAPDSTDVSFTMEWRPDPALYLAVMTGQFDLFVDEIDLDDSATALKLEVAIMVAGWSSMTKKKRKKSYGKIRSRGWTRAKRRSWKSRR